MAEGKAEETFAHPAGCSRLAFTLFFAHIGIEAFQVCGELMRPYVICHMCAGLFDGKILGGSLGFRGCNDNLLKTSLCEVSLAGTTTMK